MQAVLRDGLALRDRSNAGEISEHGLASARGRLAARLGRLIDTAPPLAAAERFAKHLANEFPAVFLFLCDPSIDATNWRAEQAIRPAVVTRKVCGGNRTRRGADTPAGAGQRRAYRPPTQPRPALADHDDAVRPRTRRARSACVAAARLTPGGVETAHPLPVLLRAPGPHSIRAVPPPPEPATRGFAASGGNATRQLAAVRGVGPRRVSLMAAAPSPGPAWFSRRRGGPGCAAEPPDPALREANQPDRPSLPMTRRQAALATMGLRVCHGRSQQRHALHRVRRPASRPSCPSFPASSQPQRPTLRCRQICAGTTSSCSNFPDGSVHFRPFPLEKISPAPGNRIRMIVGGPEGVGRCKRRPHRIALQDKAADIVGPLAGSFGPSSSPW